MDIKIVETSHILLPEEKVSLLWIIEKNEISDNELQKLLDYIYNMEIKIQEMQGLYYNKLDVVYSNFLKKSISEIHTNIKKLQIQTDEVIYNQNNDVETILQSIN